MHQEQQTAPLHSRGMFGTFNFLLIAALAPVVKYLKTATFGITIESMCELLFINKPIIKII